jgi:hypothetical protein
MLLLLDEQFGCGVLLRMMRRLTKALISRNIMAKIIEFPFFVDLNLIKRDLDVFQVTLSIYWFDAILSLFYLLFLHFLN